MYPIDNLRLAVDTAKRVLTKEKIDRQMSGQSSTTPFMKVSNDHNYSSKTVANNYQTRNRSYSRDKNTSYGGRENFDRNYRSNYRGRLRDNYRWHRYRQNGRCDDYRQDYRRDN